MSWMRAQYDAVAAWGGATGWREAAWLAAALAGLFVADRWFDVPVFIAAPIGFLGALVYGYLAHERSSRRRADLLAAAAAAWEEAEAAAESLRVAKLENAPEDAVAARGEAYAAALDRSAIVARLLADHDARRGGRSSSL